MGSKREVRRSRLVVATAAVACLGLFASSAVACTKTWVSPSSGAWTDAAAWSPAGVPTASDDVCLPASGRIYTVTLLAQPGGTAVATVTIGDAGSGAPTLLIEGSSVRTGSATQQYAALTTTRGGSIGANGTIALDATATGGPATPDGYAGGSAILAGGTLLNSGTITTQSEADPGLDNAFRTYLRASVVNEPSGTLHLLTGVLWEDSGTFQNLGAVVATGAVGWEITSNPVLSTTSAARVINSGTVTTSGGLAVDAGGAWTQAGGSVIGPDGLPGVYLQDSSLDYEGGSGSFSVARGSLSGTVPAGQTVSLGGGTVQLLGASVVNHGTIALAPNTSPFTTATSTSISGAGLDNYGLVTVASAASPGGTNVVYLRANLLNESGGDLLVQSPSFVQDSGTTTTNNGTLQVDPGDTYALSANLAQTGASTFTNSESGTVQLRLGPTSTGLVTLGAGSAFVAGGSLNASQDYGYTPVAGQSYRMVVGEGGTLSGRFARVAGGVSPTYGTDGSITFRYGATATRPTAGRGRLMLVSTCPSGGPFCPKVVVRAKAVEVTRKTVRTGKRRTTVIVRRTLVVGRASATVRPGAGRRITVVLNANGRRLLARATHTLAVKVVVSSAGHRLVDGTVAVRKLPGR